MTSKGIINKKNIDNVAIVQNIKNLIYEKKMTLAEGMLQCGYKSSHGIFYKWEQQKEPIAMESLIKIASGLSVDLFAIAPPSYFGIADTYTENKDSSTGNTYTQNDIVTMVEEINMLKDYIRLLKKEKTDLLNQLNKATLLGRKWNKFQCYIFFNAGMSSDVFLLLHKEIRPTNGNQ